MVTERPRIVLLGARGMLGTALADIFADSNPVCYDRDELDITDADAVGRMWAALRPTVVINAAADTNVDGCEEHEHEAYAVNAAAVQHLARNAARTNTLLLHYSTDYVFGGTRAEGYTENVTPAPINAYGRTKRAGEILLGASGAPFLLIRASWLFGPGGKNFVQTINAKARAGEALSVVDDQIGCPTYTVDLAQHTRVLLERGARGTHHASNTGAVSWYEFAREILRQTGSTTRVAPMTSGALQRPAQRPAYSILVNTLDPALRPWQEAVADYLRTFTR